MIPSIITHDELPQEVLDELFDNVKLPLSSGNAMYVKWFNYTSGRRFSSSDINLSLEDIFLIFNKELKSKAPSKIVRNSDESVVYRPFISRWTNWFVDGKAITAFTRNYIKSAMGLAFMKLGSIHQWNKSTDLISRQISSYSILTLAERYVLSRELMIQLFYPSFKDLKNSDVLITALITVFLSETKFECVNHNSYIKLNDIYRPDDDHRFTHRQDLGQPDSNAFGLGQWVGLRLVDYVYFVFENAPKLVDPRKIGAEIFYHPILMFSFSVLELSSPNSSYYKMISDFCNKKKIISHSEMVEFVLQHIQGIDPIKYPKQFKAKTKIEFEKQLSKISHNTPVKKPFNF